MIATIGKRKVKVPTGCEMGVVEAIGEHLDKGPQVCSWLVAEARRVDGTLRAGDVTSATITKLIWDGVVHYEGKDDSIRWAA
jgi:hypothetical protein